MTGPLLAVASAALGVVFAAVTYRLRYLDGWGSVAGGILAASLVGLGGTAWAVPALVFFVGSSALSKAGRRRKAAAAARAEKGDVRDARQVFANGGVGWMLLIAHTVLPWPGLYWAFLGAFAAATADTWATEIGTLVGGTPRMVTTGRRVPPGTSGAVSLAGTAGALLGAGVVWMAALPWAPPSAVWSMALAVVGGGLAGAFADSLLGATVQVQYRDPVTGGLVERPGPDGAPVRGRTAWDNDRVNLAGTAVGAAVAAAAFVIA